MSSEIQEIIAEHTRRVTAAVEKLERERIIALLERRRKEYADLDIQIGVATLSDVLGLIKGEHE